MRRIHCPRCLACLAVVWYSAILLGAVAAQTTNPKRELFVVPREEAIAGQTHAEVLVWIDEGLKGVLSAAPMTQSVSGQLRDAGLRVSTWTTPESPRPAFVVNIFGSTTREDEVLYLISAEYWVSLGVPLSNPRRAKKVMVFREGSYGVVARASRAATVVSESVAKAVGRFLEEGYRKANQATPRISAPVWGPPEFVSDVKEAMKGYPRPEAAHLFVQVAKDAPVAESDITAAAAAALKAKGLAVTGGSYFMSIYPQVVVLVDAAEGTGGRLMFTIRAEYRRNMEIPPTPDRLRLVRATLLSWQGVGLGPGDFARTDILQSVERYVGNVIAPHVEANGIR